MNQLNKKCRQAQNCALDTFRSFWQDFCQSHKRWTRIHYQKWKLRIWRWRRGFFRPSVWRWVHTYAQSIRGNGVVDKSQHFLRPQGNLPTNQPRTPCQCRLITTGAYQILLAFLLSTQFKSLEIFSLFPQNLQIELDFILNQQKWFGWFDFYF